MSCIPPTREVKLRSFINLHLNPLFLAPAYPHSFKRDKAMELKQALCAYVQQRVEQHQKVAGEYKELLPKLRGVNVDDISLPATVSARVGAGAGATAGSNNNKAEDEAVGL